VRGFTAYRKIPIPVVDQSKWRGQTRAMDRTAKTSGSWPIWAERWTTSWRCFDRRGC